jgi:hypothetical protein
MGVSWMKCAKRSANTEREIMSQAFQCPRIGRPAMHESERRSDVRVAQARQPPASVLRQHVEVPAHHVDINSATRDRTDSPPERRAAAAKDCAHTHTHNNRRDARSQSCNGYKPPVWSWYLASVSTSPTPTDSHLREQCSSVFACDRAPNGPRNEFLLYRFIVCEDARRRCPSEGCRL